MRHEGYCCNTERRLHHAIRRVFSVGAGISITASCVQRLQVPSQCTGAGRDVVLTLLWRQVHVVRTYVDARVKRFAGLNQYQIERARQGIRARTCYCCCRCCFIPTRHRIGAGNYELIVSSLSPGVVKLSSYRLAAQPV